ncbi:MAG TPA: prolipoprotein diacylglyceryl transferase [Fimbriimonas sp.]|nr:prolipoprotein diacylglyceryl transferase [Fimbriimonas sp.]
MYPILFHIGKFPVHTFGVVMVFAFAAAIGLAQVRAPRYGLTKNQVGDLAFWTLICGVLGARIGFIIQELPYYLSHLSELFSIQFSGLTSFGGLIAGALAVVGWAKKHRIPLWHLLDLCAPAFVIGHAIGRIGCLMNGCCFGGVCPQNLSWGVHVEGSPLLHYPAQAYDTLMNLGVVGILLWRERAGMKLGQLTGLALTLHGMTRVVFEFWRAGTDEQVKAGIASSTYWGSLPFTQAQAMAAAIVLLGVVILVACRRNKPIELELPQSKDPGSSLKIEATPA